MRALEVWNAPAEVASGFEDIEALATQCKFRDCRHESEPACAVRAAVERGELDAGRAAAYATRTAGEPPSCTGMINFIFIESSYGVFHSLNRIIQNMIISDIDNMNITLNQSSYLIRIGFEVKYFRHFFIT